MLFVTKYNAQTEELRRCVSLLMQFSLTSSSKYSIVVT